MGSIQKMSSTNSESQHRDPEAIETHSEEPSGARPRRAFAFVLGTTAALIVTAIVFFFTMRTNVPRLTRADYEAAVARWEKNGPADYDLDLELAGNRPGKIHVEVRHGKVTHMIRDGVEPSQQRTWDYWSVPGQLDTIGEEMEMAKHPAISFNLRSDTEVVMWAEFDPVFGYPREFRRAVLGTPYEVHWTTTQFQAFREKK
jgi:hypothetical protein